MEMTENIHFKPAKAGGDQRLSSVRPSSCAAREKLPYRIVPYFISSHPGCTLQDMKSLSKNKELRGIQLEQVQDFTPTPMTASSVMFYTGKDLSGRPVFVERSISGKKIQKSLFFRKNAL